jgi:hypothetical protein
MEVVMGVEEVRVHWTELLVMLEEKKEVDKKLFVAQ